MTTKRNNATVAEKINKANEVTTEEFSADVVRLNSTAVIKDQQTGKVLSLTIVLPEHADIKQSKVSLQTPAALALTGLQQGQDVSWKTPAGTKRFHIMEVKQPEMV